tara:strand:- start:118144 stop:118389 length:246 start_codon:yes stop_codon:yes gene_type:complete
MVSQNRLIVNYFGEGRAVVKGDRVNELWRGGGDLCRAGGGVCRMCAECVSIRMIWLPAILEIVLKREAFIMLVFDRFRFFT